jgi:hypothetical protein
MTFRQTPDEDQHEVAFKQNPAPSRRLECASSGGVVNGANALRQLASQLPMGIYTVGQALLPVRILAWMRDLALPPG